VIIEYVVDEIKTGYAVKYVADSSMTIGDTEVKQKGQKGLQKKTYLTVTIDGEEVSRTLMESETIQQKKDKIVHYGTKILSGVPKGLKYKEKFSRVRAVSYWYSTQRRGVYGMPCAYGTCAVDRDLIPLGSLLYIEGYGYAVANDVGTAIQGKTVDLYMERLGQCGIWGARWREAVCRRDAHGSLEE
jgi:3D (Asp-Asp-Asp) domain-containing protein